jgi:ribosomal protein L40E
MEEANETQQEERICPRCGESYTGYPALSRQNNETEICSECGMEQAIEAFQLYVFGRESQMM